MLLSKLCKQSTKTLDEFGNLLGLKQNLQKFNVFIAGVIDEVVIRLCNFVVVPKGVWPATYLGISLISTHLTCTSCVLILEKMNFEIQC